MTTTAPFERLRRRALTSRRSFHALRTLAQVSSFISARRTAADIGLRFAARDELLARKTSHRLYILGSGPSINEIDDEQWAEIRAHDSYGMNFWLIHPHVPTFYTMEFIDLVERPWARTTWNRLTALIDENATRYRDVFKIVRHLSPDARERASTFATPFLHDARFIYPLTLLSRDLDEARRAVRFAKRVGGFDLSGENPFLFAQRASIVFAYAFAIACGYDEVVFCGVDLNRPGHFFNSPRYPAYEHFLHEKPTTTGSPAMHGTEQRLPTAAPVSEVVHAIHDCFPSVRAYTANASSPLAAFLPVMQRVRRGDAS